MNNQIAFQVLKEVRDILNKINVPYFIMGGTLLGFIRNGDFIPHDDDMDIGIFIEDWSPQIVEELKQMGFKWELQLGIKELGLEYRFNKNGIQLDIFFWYKEQNYYWYAAYWKENKPENIIKLKFDKFNTYLEKFNYEYFNIPCDFAHWLEQIYGPDWRISNSNWHWCTSCKNIIQAPFDVTKNKTICLGMIVKNEGHIIKESLEAVKSIIDYWVIIDTGSTDNTKEIIKETMKSIPGELIERPWVNFGYNRTEMAKYTRNKADYTLTLDADEIITINNLQKRYLIADQYMIIVRENNTVYPYPSLFSNNYEWISEGETHEQWITKSFIVREKINNLIIDHRCCGDYRKQKAENDINLLQNALEKNPNNVRNIFYLAQTYVNLEEYQKAIEWYNKRINMGGWEEEIFYSMFNIVYCLIKLNKPFNEILEAMYRAYFYNPASAEPLYEVLRYCRQNKLYYIGYYIGRLAEQIKMPTNTVHIVRKDIYNYSIKDELSICAYWIQKYQESLDLCNQLLTITSIPNNDKIRIQTNKRFCEERLGIKSNELEVFKKDTAEEISKLPYKKYFYQYNEAEKLRQISEMKEIEKYFKKELDLDVYPIYGTLLGIVRDNDFIGWDTDIDMAYMSKYHTNEEVIDEFNKICKFLEEKQLLLYRIKTMSHLHVYSPSKYLRIDLWISWIDNNGKYHLVWTIAGEMDSSVILPFKTIKFKNQIFNSINNPEQYLNEAYNNWKAPLKGTETIWKKKPCVFELEPWHGK